MSTVSTMAFHSEVDDLVDPFINRLAELRAGKHRIIASSSFQTQSVPLLHLISLHAPETPVYFLDTGFHFPETLEYRDEVSARLNINTVSIQSPVVKTGQLTTCGRLMFTHDPENCCYLNKTLPMEPVLAGADYWITGVRKDQSKVRASFEFESRGPNGVTRLHPMLNWTKRDIWRYVKEHDLPRHPLELKGYDSIGCSPCTQIPVLGDEGNRGGRWRGQKKTECGLHTTLGGEK